MIALCADVEEAESVGWCSRSRGSRARGAVVDVESGLPVSREPSWSRGRKGAPVVRAQWRRVVDDVDEASRRVRKAWGHVVDEDTHRCCRHRACVGAVRGCGVDQRVTAARRKKRRGSASCSGAMAVS